MAQAHPALNPDPVVVGAAESQGFGQAPQQLPIHRLTVLINEAHDAAHLVPFNARY